MYVKPLNYDTSARPQTVIFLRHLEGWPGLLAWMAGWLAGLAWLAWLCLAGLAGLADWLAWLA